ncbi:hypothetical protein G6F56_011131 [Rhizopus delemar]|nr:hypothetical protein G6F56_011131 [Rhizopus delemar]
MLALTKVMVSTLPAEALANVNNPIINQMLAEDTLPSVPSLANTDALGARTIEPYMEEASVVSEQLLHEDS